MSTHVMTGTPARNKATGERVRAVLRDESEVAHVWAAQTQDHGRFRAVYFSGRRLYSYGSHYVIGELLPDGVALLNADSNSMTTNRHRHAADYATRHKTQHWIPDLTEALHKLGEIDSARRMIASLRRDGVDSDAPALERSRARLKAARSSFREYMRRDAERFADDAAAYVLKLAGLPARSWPAIQREAEREAAQAKAERKQFERRRALADMRTLARMTDSAFRELWPRDGSDDYRARWRRGLDYHGEQFARFRKRLAAAHRLASAEGLNGFKRTLWARLQAFREYESGRPERIRQARLAELREAFTAWRSGANKPTLPYDAAERFPELAGDIAELQAASEAERQAAAAEAFRKWQAGEAERPSAESFAEGSAEREAIESDVRRDFERAALRLESWRKGVGDKPNSAAFYKWRERAPAELVERVGGDPWREIVLGFSKAEAEQRLAAELEAERLKAATMAEKAAAWVAGHYDGERFGERLSDPDGGALLRIEGDGDAAELVTSHGARVPLSHAVKAFRFVKLIRERGGHWQRNGRQVRVGHYHLDSIDPAGFDAGCHRINWPEIERVAKLAGVFDCPPSDAAEIRESDHAL